MDALVCDRRCLLLTNHALVLRVIAADPGVRIRDIAAQVEITERAVESLISELISVGFLSRRRSGRRNVYQVFEEAQLRHPLVSDRTVGDLVDAIVPVAEDEPDTRAAEIPEVDFGYQQIPEETLACAGLVESSIVSSETHLTKEGGTIKQVLVYMVLASVLLCASVAVAATKITHHPKPHPSPPPARTAKHVESATRTTLPDTATAASHAPTTAASVVKTTKAARDTSGLASDSNGSTDSPPNTSGGQGQSAPQGDPGSKAPSATVTVGTTNGKVEVTLGTGGVNVDVDPPVLPPLPGVGLGHLLPGSNN